MTTSVRTMLGFIILPIFQLLAQAQETGEAEIRRFIDMLRSDDIQRREVATQELQRLGENARNRLEEAARGEDSEVRARASYLLLMLKGRKLGMTEKFVAVFPEAVDSLVGAEDSKWTGMFHVVFRRQEELGLTNVDIEPLVRRAVRGAMEKDEKFKVIMLVKRGEFRVAIPEVVLLLKDEEAIIRRNAALVLGHLKARDAYSHLRGCPTLR